MPCRCSLGGRASRSRGASDADDTGLSLSFHCLKSCTAFAKSIAACSWIAKQESKSAFFAEKQMHIPILSCWFSSKKPHIDHSQGESMLGVWGPGNFENDDASDSLSREHSHYQERQREG